LRKLTPERRAELLEYLEDLRYARGRIYSLRMSVNYDELPSPSRTALRISRLERDINKLSDDLKKAWSA
jgi:hypothetical protein